MKKFTLTLFILVVGVLCLPSVAAARSASRTYTVVTVTTRDDVPTAHYAQTTNLPGTSSVPCCLTNRINRVTLERFRDYGGITHTKIWSFYEEYRTGSRAGWVWTAQRSCGGSGSLFWSWDGCSLGPHWGHLGYTFVGGRADGSAHSLASVPLPIDLHETNKPHISMTVYGDGHVTYTRDCGC